MSASVSYKSIFRQQGPTGLVCGIEYHCPLARWFRTRLTFPLLSAYMTESAFCQHRCSTYGRRFIIVFVVIFFSHNATTNNWCLTFNLSQTGVFGLNSINSGHHFCRGTSYCIASTTSRNEIGPGDRRYELYSLTCVTNQMFV